MENPSEKQGADATQGSRADATQGSRADATQGSRADATQGSTPAWSRLIRSGAVLLSLQLGAGLLNYLYQLFAARTLSPIELSQLNSWASSFSLILVFAAAFQFRAVMTHSLKDLGTSHRTMFAAVLLFLLMSAVGLSQANAGPFVWIAIAGLAWCAVAIFHHLLGALQRRKAFWLMGLSGAAYAAARAVGAWHSKSVHDFVTVWLGAAVIGAIFALAVTILYLRNFGRVEPEDEGIDSKKQIWLRALLPGLCVAWLPVYDFFSVNLALGAETGGAFTRLQLFSKILFFAPLTLSQLSLPYYADAFRSLDPKPIVARLRNLELLGLGASYAVSLVFWLLGPTLASHVLGIPGTLSGREILLSCLNITPLYGVLCAVQTFSAAGRVREALVSVLATVSVFLLTVGIARALTLGLQELLIVSTVFNTLVGLGAWLQIRKRLSVR